MRLGGAFGTHDEGATPAHLPHTPFGDVARSHRARQSLRSRAELFGHIRMQARRQAGVPGFRACSPVQPGTSA